MGRGINILGYDGVWEGGVDAPFRMSNLELIRDTGFHHVRINMVAFRFMNDRDQLDPAFLERLDGVLEQVIANNLIPVIDEHDYDFCQSEPDRCAIKLKAFWQTLSVRYAGRFPSLVFEILNEPGGAMTPPDWNTLALDVLGIIRASNPDRTVIVSGINSDDPRQLQQLHLPPEDRNLILTIHYYAPLAFTHQGAPWSPLFASHVGINWGNASDKKTLTTYFEEVDAWAKQEGAASLSRRIRRVRTCAARSAHAISELCRTHR